MFLSGREAGVLPFQEAEVLTAWVEVGEAEGTGGVCMSKRKGKPTGTGRRTGWRQGPALEAGFLVRGQGVSGSVRSPGSLFAS